MPDRMGDAAQTRENQALFEALARQLLEEGIVSRAAPSPLVRCAQLIASGAQVAIAPWSVEQPSSPGGLLLYPTTSTRALLVGIVFMNIPFPEFVVGPSPHNPTAGPSRLQLGPSLLPRVQSFPPLGSPLPNISSTARYLQGAPDPVKGSRSGRHSG